MWWWRNAPSTITGCQTSAELINARLPGPAGTFESQLMTKTTEFYNFIIFLIRISGDLNSVDFLRLFMLHSFQFFKFVRETIPRANPWHHTLLHAF